MAIAWFICPYVVNEVNDGNNYERVTAFHHLVRTFCTPEVGGAWAGTEVLGNHLIVKVRAPETILDQIAALPGVMRLSKTLLSASLGDLTLAQKLAIRNKLIALGYSIEEIKADLGDDIGTKTFRDLLRFVAKRRIWPRWDKATKQIIFDGPERQIGKSIESIHREVSDF